MDIVLPILKLYQFWVEKWHNMSKLFCQDSRKKMEHLNHRSWSLNNKLKVCMIKSVKWEWKWTIYRKIRLVTLLSYRSIIAIIWVDRQVHIFLIFNLMIYPYRNSSNSRFHGALNTLLLLNSSVLPKNLSQPLLKIKYLMNHHNLWKEKIVNKKRRLIGPLKVWAPTEYTFYTFLRKNLKG